MLENKLMKHILAELFDRYIQAWSYNFIIVKPFEEINIEERYQVIL